jgi:uracil-DNA glycosylase family 4
MATSKPLGCANCPLHDKGAGFVLSKCPADFNGIRLLVQGEAPGKDEVDEGRPFVGKAGHWIRNNILYNAGVHESQVIFDNTLRCLPPPNKQGQYYPVGEERAAAELHCRQFDIWDACPKRIPLLLVGGCALAQRIGLDSISAWHGHISWHEGRLVGCTFHPAAVMRQPNLLPVAVRETANLLDAARNPSLLERPIVHRGVLQYNEGQPVVIDLEWGANRDVTVVGFAYDRDRAYSTYDVREGLDMARMHIEHGNLIIGHNIIDADIPKIGAVPKSFGPDHVIDTMILGHLVHAHLAELSLLDLGSLTRFYFPTTNWKHDHTDLLLYNGYDCAYNFRLYGALRDDMTTTDQWHLVEKQQRLADMSRRMQARGIAVDVPAIDEYRENWKARRAEIAKSFPFNPNSPKQIIAWGKEHGIYLSDSTYDTVEKAARSGDPILLRLLEYKDEGKSINVWFGPKYITDGYIHPSFNVTGTAVARFSCSDPNCQNIPPHLRRMIVPRDPDLEIVSFDFKNIENRTVAFAAGDVESMELWAKGYDPYKLTAALMFNVRYEDVTKQQRKDAKVTELASIYGETEWNLAERMFGNRKAESVAKARQLQRAFFKARPKVKKWQEDVARRLDRGDIMLRNPFGRVRFIYAQNSHERMKRGCHFIGCSTAADWVNDRALHVQDELKLMPILIVHDEIVVEMPKGSEGDRLRRDMKELLEAPVPQLNGYRIPTECMKGGNYGKFNPDSPEQNPNGMKAVEL